MARRAGPASAPGASASRRVARRGDEGFSLVELAVTLSLLLVVGIMASTSLFGTRAVVDAVSWRAEANTEIRRLIDQSFADLSAARPLAACAEFAVDGSCAKVTESRALGSDPLSPVPSVLLSARPDRVCYRTQRRDPVVANDASVTPVAWKACLGIDDAGQLVLVATPPLPSATYASTTVFDDARARRRVLGTVDASGGANYFTYFDLQGHGVDPTALPAADSLGDLADPADLAVLAPIAKVQLQIRLSFFVGNRRTRTRALTYTAALRSSRYEQERWWNGDKGTG